MFCEDCLKNIYNKLSMADLSVIFYVQKRNEQIDKLIDKPALKKIIDRDITESMIKDALVSSGIRQYNAKEAILFLVKIGFLKREKNDHSWHYSITDDGVKIAEILAKDKRMKEKIILNLKEKD